MSYASLKDIWPDFIASNKFQKFTDTLPQNIVNNLIQTSGNRGGNRGGNKYIKGSNISSPMMYDKSREYAPMDDKKDDEPNVEKFSNLGKYQNDCSSILKHLSHCEKCREFVRGKFAPIRETEENKDDEYLDLAIYIVTGIFILFIIDILIKFKKR